MEQDENGQELVDRFSAMAWEVASAGKNRREVGILHETWALTLSSECGAFDKAQVTSRKLHRSCASSPFMYHTLRCFKQASGFHAKSTRTSTVWHLYLTSVYRPCPATGAPRPSPPNLDRIRRAGSCGSGVVSQGILQRRGR